MSRGPSATLRSNMTEESHGAFRSVSALLTRIVDYAGLFPPAKLDMQSTVQNYHAYISSPLLWMLGRLIVPVDRLSEFESVYSSLADVDSETWGDWQISALIGAAEDEDFASKIARVHEFNEAHKDMDQLTIDVLEMRATSVDGIARAVDAIPDELFPYFELPQSDDTRGLIASLAGADAGAKVRTGGVTPDAVPSTADLAEFIIACAAADVPFKATAGLHHPLRHVSPSLNVKEFGFLNVFVAGCFAAMGKLSKTSAAELLEVNPISDFEISDDHIAWGDLKLDVEQIAEIREHFATSFGSCSFDEPTQYLQDMKLI